MYDREVNNDGLEPLPDYYEHISQVMLTVCKDDAGSKREIRDYNRRVQDERPSLANL